MRNHKFTAIVYHYVRDLKHSGYPDIKGLDIENFVKQLDYLQEHYEFISIDQVINAIDGKAELPKRSVILTFNDNLSDHYKNVFPILMDRGISGVFFSETEAVRQERMLQPHKIHFILAAAESISDVKDALSLELKKAGSTISLDSSRRENEGHGYDSGDIRFIKQLLQFELPRALREHIADRLFAQFVRIKQDIFCKDLYMNSDQIRSMIHHGMAFGSIGSSHQWLGKLSKKEQAEEIKASVEMLRELGMDLNKLSTSYPFGSYNKDTIDILKTFHFRLGFTGTADVADLEVHNSLELPRLDTNDVPLCRFASPNEWYYMAV